MTPAQTHELDAILGQLCQASIRLEAARLPGLLQIQALVNMACHDLRDEILRCNQHLQDLDNYAKKQNEA